MCFTYEDVPLPWLGRVPRKKVAETRAKGQLSLVPVSEFGPKPRVLTETIRAIMPRPKKNRSKDDKLSKAEVLLVKGIQACSGPARFDVYLSKPYGDLAGPDLGEFIGSFVKLPREHKGQLKLGITSVLEDIDADSADKVVVSLVPRHGDVIIGGLQIKLIQTDNSA